MADVINSYDTIWTAADLLKRFGAIPITRVRMDPPPGRATEADVVRIHDHENRLYELVDQTLVEKTVGTYESYLAALFVQIIGTFVRNNNLGIVLGADGVVRLAPGLVRIPDVSFISWDRLAGRRIPDEAIANLVPDLAVEIISRGNTREEMDRKLGEYFEAGVRLVWYVYPNERKVHAYRASDKSQVITAGQFLDGEEVLPNLTVSLSDIFR